MSDDRNRLGHWLAQRIEEVKTRVDYNAHDLGEFGRVIRVAYVNNILDDLATELGAR